MRSACKSARLIVFGILLTLAILLPSRMTGLTDASSIRAWHAPPNAMAPVRPRDDDRNIGAFRGQAPRLLPCGSLSFALPAPTYSAGSKPNGVATGDFNNDGKPDFAVASQASNDVTVYLGDGNGGFTLAGSFAALAGAFSVAVGDVNRDG